MKRLFDTPEEYKVIRNVKHIGSCFDNEQECINTLLYLHNKGNPIDLDPMYNLGHFYTSGEVIKPIHIYDLEADIKGYDCKQGDATNLPLESETLNCIMLDPPFMFGNHGKVGENKIGIRYTKFDTLEQLETCYKGILKEAYRLLKRNGICIFKCQDFTDTSTTMTHCLTYIWANEIGFYAKDLAILNLNKPKIYNPSQVQRHLRKTHCYFWVFVKN